VTALPSSVFQPLLAIDKITISLEMATPTLAVLDTPEGETALLRAIINARPVGMSKHWAMISVLLFLEQVLGEGRVTGEEVWSKLRTMYDLDLLDEDVSVQRCCCCCCLWSQASLMSASLDGGAETWGTTSGRLVLMSFSHFVSQSDLATTSDVFAATDEDASTSTSSRKRRRHLSSSIDQKSVQSEPALRSDFNLLNNRAFHEEFARRRKSSHSPSPSPVLMSMPLEPDGDEDEDEEDEDEDDKKEDQDGNTTEKDDTDEPGEDTVMAEEEA
jgi:hypothetical protein